MGSATYVGASHLGFQKMPLKKGRKMHKYKVHNNKFGEEIGIIYWRGGWRQYVFQAKVYSPYAVEKIDGEEYVRVREIGGIDMSRSCHKEINKFIDELMEEWKENLKKKNEKENN